MTARRKCEFCLKTIPPHRRSDARYCSPEHQKRAAERRRRKRRKAEAGELTLHPSELPAPKLSPTSRAQGHTAYALQQIRELGYYPRYVSGELRLTDIAELLRVNRATAKRALDRILEEELIEKAAGDWEQSEHVQWLLAKDLPMPEDRYDIDACLGWATAAAERFIAFEHEYFVTPHEVTGELIPFIRKQFHREWIIESLLAIVTGGYLQILSPPRHGKSQLMAHFSVWLIVRNPNIRILWVGGKDDTAKRFVNLVATKLEQEDLVRATLAPGQTYKPLKRGIGHVWQSGNFEVACRLPTVIGSTMMAVGRGGDILSLNADIIFCDDIENQESTSTAGNRKKTRTWFGVDLDSRKMGHTALIVIGSRQHYEDLYSYNMEDANFRFIVNSAHDEATCEFEENDHAKHIDCMLFAELRDHRWLMSKKYGAEARDADGVYEMVYLNDPRHNDISIFSEQDITDTFNPARVMGAHALNTVPGITKRHRVAGLDPSAVGFQAAVAFAGTPRDLSADMDESSLPELSMYDVQDLRFRRWVLDMDERLGGGVENFLKLAEQWRVELGIYEWVIEKKGFQNYNADPRVKAWKNRHNVKVHDHDTNKNKWDPRYGVGAMARYFPDLFDIPYGDGRSQRLAKKFRSQALSFVDNPEALRSRKTDILMAAWFPQKIVRRWEKELIARQAEVKQRDSVYPTSYPDLGGFTSHLNQAPWRM